MKIFVRELTGQDDRFLQQYRLCAAAGEPVQPAGGQTPSPSRSASSKTEAQEFGQVRTF